MTDDKQAELRRVIAKLCTEHRDLDIEIMALAADPGKCDQISLQRLKKRKLSLKDQISKLESELLPDIIA